MESAPHAGCQLTRAGAIRPERVCGRPDPGSPDLGSETTGILFDRKTMQLKSTRRPERFGIEQARPLRAA